MNFHLKDTIGDADRTDVARAAAIPVTFSDCIGLFQPRAQLALSRSAAVLFLSPWGLEELRSRKLWRKLAERFADAGFASLRFDYPGTGSSLDEADFSQGLSVWTDSILHAADTLKALSGCRRIILVGQSIGAALGAFEAGRREDVDGLALLAPVVNGRFYLREINLWSKAIDDSLELEERLRDRGGVTIAGFEMPDDIAASIRRLDLMGIEKSPAAHCFLAGREARPADAALADHLAGLGCNVERRAYSGYDDLISNPMNATVSVEMMESLVGWAQRISTVSQGPVEGKMAVADRARPLRGSGFEEMPVRFGQGDHLFGIVCRPTGQDTGVTAILLTTSYDHQSGWARSSVDIARNLARSGVASLRFDSANVGDSPPVSGRQEEILYDDIQMLDTRTALDYMSVSRAGPAMVVGRCSGAYVAFRSCVEDPRWAACVAINPYAFVWDPTLSGAAALQVAPKALQEYAQKALSTETVRRLLKGEINVRHAVTNIARALSRRIMKVVLPVFGILSDDERRDRALKSELKTLVERSLKLSLIYSRNDPGLENFHHHFGAGGKGLKPFPDVTVTMVADADHNFTPRAARALLVNHVVEFARALAAGTRC